MAIESTTLGAGTGIRSGRAIVAFCFLVALLEGIDIQSMGVAAPLLAAELGLNPSQLGMALSASLVGLLVGAVAGGAISDRVGRKLVLIGSVVMLGIFSLATTVAPDFQSLLVIRFLTGLGMGGAFPALIAMSSEAVDPRNKSTAVSLMYSGMPIGGALAGAIAASTIASYGWRPIFYIGGLGPLLIVPLLALLPSMNPRERSTSAAESSARVGFAQALFAEKRAMSTGLLWISFFFTLLIVYLLLNWLPSLMVAKGFTKPQGIALSMVLNIGAAIGSVTLGVLMDAGRRKAATIATYTGMALSLAGLAGFNSFPLVVLAAFAAGFFTLGGQLILYALSPAYYPAAIRGTGIGAAVAAGRFGAIAGPLVAGQILQAGGGAPTVLLAAIPCLLVGCLAAAALLSRPQAPA